MTGFTKGPWRVQPWTENEAEVRATVNGKPAHVTGYALNADARLIAAAPDLYWALEAMLSSHDSPAARFEANAAGRKALAKARGE